MHPDMEAEPEVVGVEQHPTTATTVATTRDIIRRSDGDAWVAAAQAAADVGEDRSRRPRVGSYRSVPPRAVPPLGGCPIPLKGITIGIIVTRAGSMSKKDIRR